MDSEGKKLKICHVITRMIVGGAQENTLLTIKGHVEKGHECVLVTGFSPGREGELLKNVELPPFRIETFPDLVRELSPVRDIAAFFKLRRFFREEKFDVVHTHSSKAGIIGRLAARAAKVPVVVHTVHGQAFHPYEKPWRNKLYIFLERFAAKRCDKIYAVARAMIDQCVAAGVAPLDKYQVVYSGMDTTAFASARREVPLREKLGIPEDASVVVTVARLFPLKGYEFVIPAAEKLIPEYPKLHFLIVGDGPMHDDLLAGLKKNGVDGRFHFAGLVPPHEVCRYIAQADILWHLSLREGLPRSVVQALASGIPAVGFRLDGTPEVVIDGETGFTVTPEKTGEVVEVTRRLLADPVRRVEMGKAGQKLVLERFDWRKMADILEKEYFDLLARVSGSR
ncbi:MAG: glycosyltransferase family 4 protein [Lentisphaeria bacterium]|nr:glycosyltransferase family 4 protein [Lentisphaeria bacterium]